MTTETFLAYVGIALGVIGIVVGAVVSYYFYRKSISIQEPAYSIRSNNVISGSQSNYENLRVLYGRKQVENFTVSKILFYNGGSETITRKDIETSYPLRVLTKDCQLLDASVLQVNKPSNNFTLLWDESGEFFYIDFDYLDKNQGGVIQVIHTGVSSENIKIEGDIMGVSQIAHIPPENISPVQFEKILRIALLLLTLAMMLGVASVISFVSGLSEASGMLVGIGILILLSVLFVARRRGFANMYVLPQINVLPSGLEKFLE